MPPAWPSCNGRASWRRCGFRIPSTRRCAISSARGLTRCTACAGRASSSPDFCCARDATTAGRPGPSCIAAGWRLIFEQAIHHIVLEDYIAAVEAAEARRDRLTAQIGTMLPDWTLAPVVAALQTMRGMAMVNAATLIAELGDLSRFADPRQLMAYLGLTPSEYSSGSSVRRGGITKAGNGAARRLFVEAAWSDRFPARLSRELLLRQESQPKPIRDIAWKGQVRLCARYRRLAPSGKPAHAATTPLAGELTGFVWAIARQVTVTPG